MIDPFGLPVPSVDRATLGDPEGIHDDDKPHEECGVFGIWNAHDAGAMTALGLHALQHRGQEATGIVSFVKEGRATAPASTPTRAWAWSATCSATRASSAACRAMPRSATTATPPPGPR